LTMPVSGYETLRDIATISANNDPDLGTKIAEAFHSVGLEGTVAAEAAPGAETSVRFIDGVEIDAGYISQSFLINQGQSDVNLVKARVLLCEDDLSSIAPCLGLLNKVSDENTQLLIVAKDVRQEALATLVANNKIGNGRRWSRRRERVDGLSSRIMWS